MNVFDIQAKINLNTKDYIESLGQASKETSDFGSKVKGAFSASMKVGAAAIGAVVTETVALSGALIKGVNDLATYGDHIDKQSQKMNMSAQAYQEWSAIMQHSGTSIDSMQMAMKTLANAAETDSEAFAALGMNLEDVKNMNSEELFSKTITALQNVESDTQRTYIAGQLLGRGATELGALLNTSAEDTEKMRQRVHELGGVMSDEAVKASAKFKDSLQDMKTSMKGIKNSLLSEFLPSFTQVMDGLTSIFAGEEGGAEKVSAGIDQILKNIDSATGKLKPVIKKIGGIFVTAVKENAPKLIKEGASIFGDLVIGTIKNLPEIISTSGEILSGIGDSIVSALPELKDTAFNVVKGFAGYLSSELPVLIPEGVNAVIEFAKGVTSPENVGTLIDAAFDIVNGLIDGLTNPKTINAIVEGAPVIVENIVTGIEKAADKLADAALSLTSNLLDYLGDPDNRKKLNECGEKILDTIARGFTNLLETGGESIYNLGGQIAKNIGLADYWTVGDEAFGDFWKGFKSDWEEFKTWFNIEWKDLLSPISLGKSVTDSVTNKMSEVFAEKENGKKESAYNYDELEALGPTREGIPDAYKKKHGNLADRKHELGGIFTRPVTIGGHTFGENGIEGLLPLENNTSWMDKLVDKINGSGDRYYTINVYADSVNSEADFDILVEKLDRKLEEKHIMDTRAIGGTGYGG